MSCLFLCMALVNACPRAAVAQEPAQPQWKPLNRAALIVNEAIITDEDVRRAIQRTREPINSEDDFRRIQARIVQQRVQELLEEQAGKVLGYAPELVDRYVQDEMDRQKEDAGSISKLAQMLKERDIDSFTHKDDARAHTYGQLWLGYATGRLAGPTGRPSRDRYVRPGRLYFEFCQNAERLAQVPTVRLHELAVPIAGPDSAAEVKQILESAIERVRAGEDFAKLAAEIDPRAAKEGLLKPMPEDRLKVVPEIYEFVRSSEPGAVSDVKDVIIDGVLRGYRVIQLIERIQPKPAVFADREYQSELARRVQESLDQYRVASALEDLLGAAFVWPPESFRRPSAGEAAP